MDNTNSFTQSILQSSKSSAPSASLDTASIYSNSGSSSEGFFDFFTNISLSTWLIIILILAFLGFNVFVYLAKGTEDIRNFLIPSIS